MDIAYVNNTNSLTLTGLRKSYDNTYINNATVSFSVEDENGNVISSGAMTYVTSSNGNYIGYLGHTVSLTADTRYVAKITADGGAGPPEEYGYWEYQFVAKTRRE
jgi:hypothetical protein